MNFIQEGLINIFDGKNTVNVNGESYIINPLTDHQPFTTYEMLETVIQGFLKVIDVSSVNKIIGEEDRGGFITALISYKTKIPFGLVKWNPLGYEGEIGIEFRNMYTSGKMYLNGAQSGDSVIIVEDMIDSGGTIISMIKLLEKNNIKIKSIFSVGVKEGLGGLDNIYRETGYKVNRLCKFRIEKGFSRITDFNKLIK